MKCFEQSRKQDIIRFINSLHKEASARKSGDEMILSLNTLDTLKEMVEGLK